jgi:hypothetical protein
MSVGQNTLDTFLGLLKVRHTKSFTGRLFNEHPHKYNLFGLSKMLSDYGVDNAATKITEKEENISAIETPFVAHFGGEFVVVKQVGEDALSIIRYGKEISVPLKDFLGSWSGVVLLAETTEESSEPNFSEHRKKDLLQNGQEYLLYAALGALVLSMFFAQSLFRSRSLSMLLLLNIFGAYISWLLVLKSMRIGSRYADKICSLFNQHDCNDVLESSAAKLFGVLGWSEVGLGYFVSNVLILLFAPNMVSLLATINLLALPYTLWSVWYQKVRAKQWCVLCLIVQALLWLTFTVNFVFGFIQIPTVDLNIFAALCVLGGLTLAINILAPKLNRERYLSHIKQEINSLKADEDVFKAFLIKQPCYTLPPPLSNKAERGRILFGNSGAKLNITILSNPYCNPCARMHKRMERLLKDTNNQVCIEYVLSSFTDELESTNKFLIAAALQKDKAEMMKIFSNWFENGKLQRDEFFKDWGLDMSRPEIEAIFQKHKKWKEETKLTATPAILVNGYKLPENYRIEDLRYFAEFDFEIK